MDVVLFAPMPIPLDEIDGLRLDPDAMYDIGCVGGDEYADAFRVPVRGELLLDPAARHSLRVIVETGIGNRA